MSEAVEAARQGNSEGQSYLYEQTYRKAYYVALKYMQNEDDAYDIVHDAYMKAFGRLNQLEDDAKFDKWLNTIVASTALDAIKKKKPQLFSDMSSDDDEEFDVSEKFEADYSQQPEVVIDQNETARLVQEIISELSDEQRACVTMYYMQEMSVKEISGILNVSDNTVKSRLNYARKNIEAKVKELEKKGTKLYALAPIPFFVFLLHTEADACEAVAVAEMFSATTGVSAGSTSGATTGATNTSAASNVSSASATEGAGAANATVTGAASAVNGAAGATAAGAGTLSLGAKIAIGIVAAVVVIGGAVGVGIAVSNSMDDSDKQIESEEENNNTTQDVNNQNAIETNGSIKKELDQTALTNYALEFTEFGCIEENYFIVKKVTSVDYTGDKLDETIKAKIAATNAMSGNNTGGVIRGSGNPIITNDYYKECSLRYFGEEIPYTQETINKTEGIPITSISDKGLVTAGGQWGGYSGPQSTVKDISRQDDGSYIVNISLAMYDPGADETSRVGDMQLIIESSDKSPAGMVLKGVKITK